MAPGLRGRFSERARSAEGLAVACNIVSQGRVAKGIARLTVHVTPQRQNPQRDFAIKVIAPH